MPELEAIWGDLAAATKWLFLSLPKRVRPELGISAEIEEQMTEICTSMLRQVAFRGQMQLASAEKPDADVEVDK